ncbi:MAG: HigA family addiction module antitoxin [Terriglobia bacterium]
MAAKLKPIHPGEILREEFMKPLGLNSNKLSLALRVPAPTVYEIVHEKRSISPEMALRLARCFSIGADFWLNLQSRYDLELAEDRTADRVKREVEPLKAAARGSEQ